MIKIYIELPAIDIDGENIVVLMVLAASKWRQLHSEKHSNSSKEWAIQVLSRIERALAQEGRPGTGDPAVQDPRQSATGGPHTGRRLRESESWGQGSGRCLPASAATCILHLHMLSSFSKLQFPDDFSRHVISQRCSCAREGRKAHVCGCHMS